MSRDFFSINVCASLPFGCGGGCGIRLLQFLIIPIIFTQKKFKDTRGKAWSEEAAMDNYMNHSRQTVVLSLYSTMYMFIEATNYMFAWTDIIYLDIWIRDTFVLAPDYCLCSICF